MIDHLTIWEHVYFQRAGQETTDFETVSSRQLSNLEEEEPYYRQTKATETWKPIDCGWFKDKSIGMIVIRNDEGKFRQTIPTEEEAVEARKRILEVRYQGASDDHVFLILSQESFRATPKMAPSLEIRCQCGVAKFSLGVFPA
jgi:hypothetical protein